MRAVTYMPARNTDEQLSRIKSLCESNVLLQISGEDINNPLQKFICEKIETPEHKHLIDTAWALIGHELASSKGLAEGMFSPETITHIPELNDRIKYFAEMAMEKLKKKRKM